MHASNGILFNHESPRRGETFVTRKITRAATRVKLGLQDCLYIGNLEALRDWGYAPDFVEAMWLMLQQDEPDDFVIATGEMHSVREFIERTFTRLDSAIEWRGKGVDEQGVTADGDVVVRIDKHYFRPAEVEKLLGDPAKAWNKFGWKPRVTFDELVTIMTDADLELAREEAGKR